MVLSIKVEPYWNVKNTALNAFNAGSLDVYKRQQYNRMLDKIAYLEKEGRIHVIRPDRDISAKPVERDPAHLKEIYEVGRRVMKADMEKLKAVSYTHLNPQTVLTRLVSTKSAIW